MAGRKRKAIEPADDAPKLKQTKHTPKFTGNVIVPIDDTFNENREMTCYYHVPIVQVQKLSVKGHARVYIDNSGVIFDVSLNQTNTGQNNNKFYRLQLLGDGQIWHVHTRWGRVGERGQSKTLGPFADFERGIKEFEKKFKDKTGLKWEDRNAESKKGKYSNLERSYDDEDEGENVLETGDNSHRLEDKVNAKAPAPKSKLPIATQKLIELIFNEGHFDQVLRNIGYNGEKLPLGKLGKTTLKKGFEFLKNLADLFNDSSLAASKYEVSLEEAIEDLTNRYYSTIPHIFGRNTKPILINNIDVVQREVEMLDTLSDMEVANKIMKTPDGLARDAEKLNLLDQRYKQLNLEELQPLPHTGKEFSKLKKYLVNTSGNTHDIQYQLIDVFRVTRSGDPERFGQANKVKKGAKSCRRLLWHGSRTTNFGGILSQGLRIAPPEAPVSGYNFGKGIYFADVSTKSANYCAHYSSGGTALLLLCEIEVGDPAFELASGDCNAGELAARAGCISTKGVGRQVPESWTDAGMIHDDLKGVLMPDVSKKPIQQPSNGHLEYNEYIVYDVNQVRLRYLLKVQITGSGYY